MKRRVFLAKAGAMATGIGRGRSLVPSGGGTAVWAEGGGW